MDQQPMNSAAVSIRAGKVRVGAKVKLTNGGLLAIGGLVSSILLSTTALVWAATSVAREHPVSAGLLRRR